MKITQLKFYFILFALTICIPQCKKKEATAVNFNSNIVLANFAEKLLIPNLVRLDSKADLLSQSIALFVVSSTDANLKAAQNTWLDTRLEWEQSEACLFGPVATLELDPAIDSWPVNFVEIDSVLNSSAVFSDAYIDSLSSTLKGFHSIEYLLFGKSKSRKAIELTNRQKDFLLAISKHLKKITKQMHWEWESSGNNYEKHLLKAGTAESIYKTKKEAMLEVVNGIIGIVDEVANGKIHVPFLAQDSTLEESPFALNSWTDFTNNIIGAENAYFCIKGSGNEGVHTFVSQYSLALNTSIEQQFSTCINSLKAFKEPFGRAIYNQPTAITSLQTQLNELKTKLENELLPLIQLRMVD